MSGSKDINMTVSSAKGGAGKASTAYLLPVMGKATIIDCDS